MRLWSLHPQYLDRQGLTAVWREALLAQAVLRGRTRGYRAHPQLERFRSASARGLIAAYLVAIWKEAGRRGYRFDAGRIRARPSRVRLPVERGQVAFEWDHLRRKLRRRSPAVLACWRDVASPEVHPLFRVVPGGLAAWERGAGGWELGAGS